MPTRVFKVLCQYVCDHCDKIFDEHVDCVLHERNEHEAREKRRRPEDEEERAEQLEDVLNGELNSRIDELVSNGAFAQSADGQWRAIEMTSPSPEALKDARKRVHEVDPDEPEESFSERVTASNEGAEHPNGDDDLSQFVLNTDETSERHDDLGKASPNNHLHMLSQPKGTVRLVQPSSKQPLFGYSFWKPNSVKIDRHDGVRYRSRVTMPYNDRFEEKMNADGVVSVFDKECA